jgi:hypothetical protein
MENILSLLNSEITKKGIENTISDKIEILNKLDEERDEIYKNRFIKDKSKGRIKAIDYHNYYDGMKHGLELSKIARTFLNILVEWNNIKGEMDKSYLNKNWKEMKNQCEKLTKLMDDNDFKKYSSRLHRMGTIWKGDSSLKNDLKNRVDCMYTVLASARKIYRKGLKIK